MINVNSVRDFLDNLPKEEVTVVYGESATGKTTLAFQAVVDSLRKGEKVFFVDSERSFSVDRLRQMEPSIDSYLDNLKLFHPRSFSEQSDILESLPVNCGLIVVDSLSKYYRIDLKKNYSEANILAVGQLRRLHKFVDAKIPVILINQVYSGFSVEGVVPVGKNLIKKWSKVLVRLDKAPGKFVIEKPLSKEFGFAIVNEGLV
jgi:RecA/RadA recombinase